MASLSQKAAIQGSFRNNDIYRVADEDYEEPRERHPKVQYKLKIADNPAVQNMPHEEEFDDKNYESIDEDHSLTPLSLWQFVQQHIHCEW